MLWPLEAFTSPCSPARGGEGRRGRASSSASPYLRPEVPPRGGAPPACPPPCLSFPEHIQAGLKVPSSLKQACPLPYLPALDPWQKLYKKWWLNAQCGV